MNATAVQLIAIALISGFAFLFTLSSLRVDLGAWRHLLFLGSWTPLATTALLLGIDSGSLMRADGSLTAFGTFVSFFPTIVASTLPMLLFATRWWRSPPGLERSRALWLLLPFLFWSIHDGLLYFPLALVVPSLSGPVWVSWPLALTVVNLARLTIVAAIALLAVHRRLGPRTSVDDKILILILAYSVPLSLIQLWGFVVHGLVDGLIVLLFFYGIARYQILDIDLGIRIAVEKSTLLGAFAIAFLVASEAVERAIGIEGTWFGLAAALAIGLVFRRIERFATRFAEHVLPHTRDIDHVEKRRRDVYRNAVQIALRDGRISERERDRLAELADRLGLSAGIARALEREIPSATAEAI